jgi:hypothetical protein
MQNGPQLRHREPGFVHAVCGSVSVGAWTASPTIPHLELLAETQRRILREHPAGFAVVNVVAGMPSLSLDSRVREYSETMIRSFAPSILAIATVVEAKGFFASAVRAFLLSQQLVSRSRYANSVFEHVDQVPAWMAKYVTAVASPDQQTALLDTLRAALAALAK